MGDLSVRILHGDCRELLRTLPDASVQCCVTSPPYYRLRDAGHPAQIGMEADPERYLSELTTVFREVRRILVPDGLLFLNLGDSYREKQRLMIPARSALALQSDGWLIVDEIVWHKPRTTPRSLTNRTVPSHEMIFMLAKTPAYYFDFRAIVEPAIYAGLQRKASHVFRDLGKASPDPKGARPAKADRIITVGDTRRKRSVWSVSPPPYADGHFSTMAPEIAETCIKAGSRFGDTILDPFGGAGTTGIVADRLARNAVLVELVPENCDAGQARFRRDAGLFAEVAAE